MDLISSRRGTSSNIEYLNTSENSSALNRILITFEIPLGEILIGFYDHLKSVTQGYGSMDYEIIGFKQTNLAKVDILINQEKIDSLSTFISKEKSYYYGKELVSKLKELIPRQLFEIPIQAAIGSKIIARDSKVNTPNWEIVTRGQTLNEDNSEFPLVIKPNDQGSTVGLTIVHDESELGPALNLAYNYSSSVMVEQFIKGRELTVTLMGSEAYPVCEIIPSHELYDYECKYTSGMSTYVCPADIGLDLTERVQEISERLFNVLKCRHYSRADFRLDHEDNLWFLEMNTLPGMTDTSLAPITAKAAGLSFNDLIECIVLQAWSE